MTSIPRVSICGGGVGGLVLAVVLGKYGTLPVEIFEAGPIISTTGAGISLYPRPLDIMKALGLYDELVSIAAQPPQKNTGPNFRKWDQEGPHWFTKKLPLGRLSIHRKDAVDCFLRHIPSSCKIHVSKKLTSYEVDSERGEIILHFSDGSTSVTDVLVGADGIHSATRKTMYQNLASLAKDEEVKGRLLACIDPVWTGTLVYRNLISTEKLLKNYPDVPPPTQLTFILGKSKHITMFPIHRRGQINISMFVHNSRAFGTPFGGPWVTDVSEEEISDHFKDWDIRASALVKCVEKPSRWALHSTRLLPNYVAGKVALIGDAAHAMEPHFGVGAGQAIEDAFVLGRLLTHELTNRRNVTDALKVYEQVRLPFANDIVQRSQDIGRYYGFHSAEGSTLADGNPEQLNYVRKLIEDAWEWQTKSGWMWGEAERRWRAACGASVKL